MSIEVFFTTQTTSPVNTAVFGNSSAGGAKVGSPVFHFLDLISGFLNGNIKPDSTADVKIPEVSGEVKTALSSESPVLDKNPSLDIAQLLTSNPDVEEQAKILSEILGNTDVMQTLALNQKALDAALKPVTGEVTDTAQIKRHLKVIQSILVQLHPDQSKENIQNLTKKLLSAIDPEAASRLVFHATDINITPEVLDPVSPESLTPESMAIMRKRVKNALNILEVSLVAAAPIENPVEMQKINAEAKIVQNSINPPSKEIAIGADVISPKLNTAAAQPVLTASDLDESMQDTQAPLMGDTETASADSDDIISSLGKNLKTTTGESALDFVLPKTQVALKAPPPVAPVNALFDSNNPFFAGSVLAESALVQDRLHASPQDGDTVLQNTMPMTSTPGVSAIGMANSTVSKHPVMPLVLIAVRKGVAGGVDKNIVLQLDPPELGRVEIRLTFNEKDKSIKASVIAETADALDILQRDSQQLERALQGTGLDASGGLNFELADDSHPFRHDGQDGGARQETGRTGLENGGVPEIELNLWTVDPQTGHLRYSILT